MFEVEFKGGEELAKALRELPEALTRQKMLAILHEAGQPIADLMRILAPRRSFSARERAEAHTGYTSLEHMADSITMRAFSPSRTARAGRDPDHDHAIEIGPTRAHFYAFFLEHGTAHMGARAFARPAFDDGAPSALRIIRKRLWDVVRDEAQTRYTPTAGGRFV